MPDQTTSYQIAVTDGVDPQIERKLTSVSNAAKTAGTSCASLQSQLDKLNASGITNAAQAMRNANTAQRQLQASATQTAKSFDGSTRAVFLFTSALGNLRNTLALTIPQLQVLTTTVLGFSQAARGAATAATGAGGAAATGFAGTGRAATTSAVGVRGFSSAIGFARGNMMSANYAAGRFISTLVGTGPIVQAAFSALGVIALIVVLGELVNAIGHVRDAYREMTAAGREATLSNALGAAQGVESVEAQVGLLEASARVIAKAKGAGNTILGERSILPTTSGAVAEIARQKELLASQNAVNEAGLKSAALARQKRVDLQSEIALNQKLKQSLVDVARTNTEVINDPNSSKKQREAAASQVTSANVAFQDAQVQDDVLVNRQKAEDKIAAVASVKDEAKAARAEMQRLEAAYKDYVTTLSHKITPGETLDYWQTAEAHLKHYAANIDAVNAKEAAPLQAIASRNDNLGRTNEGLDEQISNIGTYNDALKEKQQLDRLTIQFQKTGIPLTAEETKALREKITTIVENAQYQQELNAQYTAATGPLDKYIAAQQALTKLTADDPANAGQYAAQLNVAQRAYTDATQPLAEYSRGIKQQIILLGEYGTALKVETELQRVGDTLRARGQTLNQDQLNSLRDSLTQLENAKQVQADINAMYEKNAGALERLTLAQRANNEAYLSGVISVGQYRTAAIAAGVAQAELANDRGLGTWSTRLEASLGELAKGFTSVADGAQKAFTGFFSTLSSGFADSIGHAIAFGGSVKTALLDTARQAVAGLISSLIKLAIQYLITTALAKAFNIQLPKADSAKSAKETLAGTAAAIAAIAAITAAQFTAINVLTGPAWDLAEAVSLFSFGANAVPAEAGIAAVISTGQAAAHFASGGYVSGPGTTTSDSIPARLSTGEYVINARATAEHHDLLDSINSNRRITKFASGGYVAGTSIVQQSYAMQSTPSGSKLIIEDHTSGVKFVPGGHSEDEIRVIARDVVQKDADGVVGNALTNGNSQTRRALHQNTSAAPRRG